MVETTPERGKTHDAAAAIHPPAEVNNNGVGRIPIQPGELDQEEYERPGSAPPPPGLGGNSEQRHRVANEILWGQTPGAAVEFPAVDTSFLTESQDKNSSFSNLAAVLGTGLAQSMEDAADGNHHIDALFRSSGGKKDTANFQRQARHNASRLLGVDMNEAEQQPTKAGADAATTGLFSSSPSPFRSHMQERADGNNNTREAQDSVRRATTPVQMFPGQHGEKLTLGQDSKDVGMKVREPSDNKLESDFQQEQPPMFSLDAKEFKPQGFDSKSVESDLSDGLQTEVSAIQAESEIRQYIWDIAHKPSRTIAILRASWLRAPDVRAACEQFGAIDSFRADFASRQGIFFCAFYDIRSAQYAAMELQPILVRSAVAQGSNEEPMVRYCLALNSSSQFDESQIVISGLQSNVDQQMLASMLSPFGSLRSIVSRDFSSFIIEFHNIQDAKQALLELDSGQPWGPDVTIEVGLRNPVERKRGREMLGMISRWRHGTTTNKPSIADSRTSGITSDPWSQQQTSSAVPMSFASNVSSMASTGGVSRGFTGISRSTAPLNSMETQYMMGPDGRYQQVFVQKPVAYGQPQGMRPQQMQQQLVQGPDGQMYMTAVPVVHHGGPLFMQQGDQQFPPTIITGDPPQRGSNFYSHYVPSDNVSAYSGGGPSAYSGMSHRSLHSQQGDDKTHLMLDLDAVEEGADTRTSLMVRNIPNKYTQQMLLSEFMENGHGPGVIDFFYLPIDFKNRCNRGYAFINFVNYMDILDFHERYFGKHWKTFNSDKICDITYARIQGKAAMLKRFENSALMEKDEEYKPLVFVSDGPDKGKRLPFAEAHPH